jgi:DNA-damage-inducible protein J
MSKCQSIALHSVYLNASLETVMPAHNALVQTRIDPEVRDRAAAVLEGLGLTVSDVVRMLLTRIANEGNIPIELTVKREEYDAWFRAKVIEAMSDPRPTVAHDQVEATFAAKRAALIAKPVRG